MASSRLVWYADDGTECESEVEANRHDLRNLLHREVELFAELIDTSDRRRAEYIRMLKKFADWRLDNQLTTEIDPLATESRDEVLGEATQGPS